MAVSVKNWEDPIKGSSFLVIIFVSTIVIFIIGVGGPLSPVMATSSFQSFFLRFVAPQLAAFALITWYITRRYDPRP